MGNMDFSKSKPKGINFISTAAYKPKGQDGCSLWVSFGFVTEAALGLAYAM